jgi:hypothetical protein
MTARGTTAHPRLDPAPGFGYQARAGAVLRLTSLSGPGKEGGMFLTGEGALLAAALAALGCALLGAAALLRLAVRRSGARAAPRHVGKGPSAGRAAVPMGAAPEA